MADDLYSLARDLGDVPAQTAPFARKAVEVSARNIKDSIRNAYQGAYRLPGAARSISYDMKESRGGVEAEIGPQLGGQGSLVGLVDEGTTKTPGKKRIVRALADEVDGFDKGVQQAIDDGLKAAGL